ncbi:MarR family transcriptional regulator [Paracoccus sp. S1E-3]|uniref:MarR family winged helix-turn-helix transcriptional regulator n=1 Tax=Paracoccus sp. S1E-3 TaxID=2756130 RepID=UPI0015EF0B6F|nr:MarR family transcriptional regulator [Paracoccus sp. S1E-3]MBA4491234.1 MarR family transcriptional regulator [Paracoccus sp. S1E-3]
MKDFDYEPVAASKIELGYLAGDITFMARVLFAHVRLANAEFHREWDTVSGTLSLLSLIGLNPGISQNDLASTVVMKKSAVTKLIGELEAKGLVIRDKPKSDRRFNALSLSLEGEALWLEMRDRLQERQEFLLQPLNTRDRDRLFALLQRLVAYYADPSATSRRADATEH